MNIELSQIKLQKHITIINLKQKHKIKLSQQKIV